jgi:tRNA A-37 threonylcarbamoyl transferase component Bud32
MECDPFSAAGQRPLLSRRYRIGALVGSGAMAEVYRAYDLKLERPVAIKRFTATSSAIDRQRFDVEARLLAGLSHPGLVTVYDVGQHQDGRYLVMRLVDDPSLHAALAKERPTVDEVVALANRLLPTLAYVHDRGIVHRDIKPSNILIDLDGEAYLADFGLARLVGSDNITRSGEIVGTAAYLAPEQVRGEPTTPASDVYARGLVLLQCLTGRQEYGGGRRRPRVRRRYAGGRRQGGWHRNGTATASPPATLMTFVWTREDVMLLRTALVAASVAGLLASGLVTGQAHAATSYCGSACDGKDPATYLIQGPGGPGNYYHCADDAVTVEYAAGNNGTPSVELRYSLRCATAWARTGYYYDGLEVQSFYSNGTLRRVQSIGTDPNHLYTQMVNDQGLLADACVREPYSSWICTWDY